MSSLHSKNQVQEGQLSLCRNKVYTINWDTEMVVQLYGNPLRSTFLALISYVLIHSLRFEIFILSLSFVFLNSVSLILISSIFFFFFYIHDSKLFITWLWIRYSSFSIINILIHVYNKKWELPNKKYNCKLRCRNLELRMKNQK